MTVADGLYYIKNAASGLYLQDGDTLARTFAKETDQAERIPQLWKITHISHGNYSIRPIDDLSRALYVTPAGSVCTNDAAIADGGLNSMARWQIRQTAYGYAFLQGGLTSKTMTPIGTTANSLVNARAWSASAIAHWELEEALGIFLRDDDTHHTVDTTTTKTIELGQTYTLADLGIYWEYYGSLTGENWSSNRSAVASVDSSGTAVAKDSGEAIITLTATINGTAYTQSYKLSVPSTDPFHYTNIQYVRYTNITGTDLINQDNIADLTISIVKSALLEYAYCVILDNINAGYYRCIYIDESLKNTLNSLEEGYQEHYNIIPGLDTSTEQEKQAHIGKLFTDELVAEGHFSFNSSEYWGAWAYNYVSVLNLFEYWQGALDTATKAYSVYLSVSAFFYSYLYSTNTITTNINSTQYNTSAMYIDDIDDVLTTTGYTNKNIISAKQETKRLDIATPPHISLERQLLATKQLRQHNMLECTPMV